MHCVINLFIVVYLIHNVLPHSNVGISGGHTVPIENAPFMASLVRFFNKLPNGGGEEYMMCGSSIIHERFVLTAAHCLGKPSYLDIVRVGSSQLMIGGDVFNVEKLIPHENYTDEELNFEYDIGLVKLNKSIMFGPKVVKVVLADEHVKIEDRMVVNVTGWGRTGLKGHVSQQLRQVTVKLRPISDCTVYPWNTDQQLCSWTFRKGPCKGDSGSPLTRDNVQIGVESNGLACGFLPSIFVKVAPMLSWITKTIENNI